MRKVNEENERIKRKYLKYLKTAKRRDAATVQKAADGIVRFEASTNYASFKKFRIEQVIKFREQLEEEVSKATGKPLSKSTISSVLAANKNFIFWLANQSGYKSRIRHSDADYFNMDAKGQRAASASRPKSYPSLEMVAHAFAEMPKETEIDRRNRAAISLFMLTGIRDGAAASMRLKHVNLIEGYIFQDAREVKTKRSKSFTSYFLPIGEQYLDCFTAWVDHLSKTRLFGPDDPLFPPPEIGHVDGAFSVIGLKRNGYKNANALRALTKEAFVNASLPAHAPHAFRTTLTKWADGYYTTREAFKAFSQNLGHSSEITTISAYCPVPLELQARLLKKEEGRLISFHCARNHPSVRNTLGGKADIRCMRKPLPRPRNILALPTSCVWRARRTGQQLRV